MKPSLFITSIGLTLGCFNVTSAAISSATVSGGKIEGAVVDDIAAFKGIPYAAPPTGELRWKPPQPVKPWVGIKKLDGFGPAPIQDHSLAAKMGISPDFSEDCLYLNVWTPAETAEERLPVMVWIYGGGFAGGATSCLGYDGTHLAQKGVVVVSVAYRVGPLGFLAIRS